ncbi:hypothetical protein E0I56_005680 [Escherichia coli]|nr:hypothetical protein [Escherichia coli]
MNAKAPSKSTVAEASGVPLLSGHRSVRLRVVAGINLLAMNMNVCENWLWIARTQRIMCSINAWIELDSPVCFWQSISFAAFAMLFSLVYNFFLSCA